MELINKDAIVAEIKKRIKYYQTKNQKWGVAGYAGRVAEGEEILDYINTLEVKEVDLTNEVSKWLEENCDNTGYFNQLEFARYFFELGLKVQKGE
jgi:hypothetical protein